MTDKYCDHGFYSSAEFVANITSGNTTITVTSVTTANISLGMVVVGTGIPADTTISNLGTGKGGTGTYTLSKTPTATNTGVSVSGTYGGMANTPIWGVAQDGDGLTKTAATPAMVSIDMTSWTFSTSSTVAIMGSTAITCTSSATTSAASTTPNAQYSATLTTMIDNLVTAINWQSSVVVNYPSGWPTSSIQVRYVVFARRNGNSLELMTRGGSASFNTLVAATFANVTGSSPASWSGGVSGVWGFISNTNHDLFSGGFPSGSYGVFSPILPFGTRGCGDRVFIRSNKTILSVGYTPFAPTNTVLCSNRLSPLEFIVDDGTEWSAPTNPVLTFKCITQGGGVLGSPTQSYESLTAKYDEDTGYYGLVFDGSAQTANAHPMRLGIASRNLTGIKCIVSAAYTGSSGTIQLQDYQYAGEVAIKHIHVVHSSQAPFIQSSSSTSSVCGIKMKDITLESTGYAAQHPGVISFTGPSGNQQIDISNIKMVGFTTGSTLFGAAYNGRFITIKNPSFGGVTRYGGMLCEYSANYANDARDAISISSIYNDSAFVRDTRHGFCEWNPLRAYPTLSGQLQNGIKFSIRAHPSTISGRVAKLIPYTIPPILKVNSLDTGARTFTVQLAVRSTLSPTSDKFWVVIDYIDSSGNLATVSSETYAATALTASTETWSAENGSGQPVYDDGGTLTFNKYKITVSTLSGRSLAKDTIVSSTICLAYTPASVSEMVFIDPDIGIA